MKFAAQDVQLGGGGVEEGGGLLVPDRAAVDGDAAGVGEAGGVDGDAGADVEGAGGGAGVPGEVAEELAGAVGGDAGEVEGVATVKIEPVSNVALVTLVTRNRWTPVPVSVPPVTVAAW